jgi:hypothetical protein
MSDQPNSPGEEGVFPVLGPVAYLTDDEMTARRMLAERPFPIRRTWWHVTYSEHLTSVLTTGLIPSCWWGGDTCAVFGTDSPTRVPTWRRDDWVIQIRSHALPDAVKAWWVSACAIQGAWRRGRFYSRTKLLAGEHDRRYQHREIRDGCVCTLTDLCREQQSAWRATWQ